MNVDRMDRSGRCKWTAIVLTCQSIQNAQAFQTELNLRQDRGDIDKETILLTVEDPKSQVGSGGATLNALLVVAEHISAKTGYTVVNSDVLNTSLILIVHMGRSFPYDPCGRAFVSLPLIPEDSGKGCESLVCNLDLLLETLTTKFAPCSTNGVWVCSSDMFLQISSDVDKAADVFEGADAVVVTVPGSVDYAEKHGIYKITSDGEVENILYQCKSADAMKDYLLPNDSVPLVTGVVYLSVRVADRLLACHVLPPLSSCTYIGQDSGTCPIQLSLFFDFMLAMCSGVSEETFVASGPWGGAGEAGSGDLGGHHTVHTARRLIWRNLNKFKVKALLLEGTHSYMDLRPLTHHRHLLTPVFDRVHWSSVKHRHAFLHPGADVHEDVVVINSIIESGVKVGSSSVVSNCYLGAALAIGSNSMVSGIIPDDVTVVGGKLSDGIVTHAYQIVLPMFQQTASQRVLVVFGLNDRLETSETFCNVAFSKFLSRTGITDVDLWDSTILEAKRTLMNARLFPFLNLEVKTGFAEIIWLQENRNHSNVDDAMLKRWKSSWRLSLEEILSILDVAGHFEARRKLFFDVASETIRDTLVNCRNFGLNKLFRSAITEGCAQRILEVLDNVGIASESPGIAARTLASIAEVLGAMSRGEGGLRSGPASNLQWEPAFQLLEREEIADGFRAMASERARWLMRPSHIVRAARHYEGAAQILIRHAVMSARKFIRTQPCKLVPLNKWVTVECPARIDIAGGWSDTPPITYEHGGAVLDAAITVNGKNPIGCKVQGIERLQLVLHVENDEIVVVSDLDSLKDYNQPHAPGALLKAAMLCADIIQYPSELSLSDQLHRKYGRGFEVYTWSNLPHGSGLGTSSILAGAVMAALWRASGKAFDINSLNHAVLHLEQLLTTGGGWQDQVGGLTVGIKVGHSKAELPVKIEMTFLEVSSETVRAFSDRLLLVYTGKTRLARNLLQDVIRNWYARNPEIVDTEDRLVANVWTCAKAFEEGNLEAVGKCLSEYWKQKKVMAPGCEPEAVGRMMEALRPHTLGMSMAGAGGGGFLYLLTKEPNAVDLVRDILSRVQGTENAEVYDACVNEIGLELTVDDFGSVKVPLWFNDDVSSS